MGNAEAAEREAALTPGLPTEVSLQDPAMVQVHEEAVSSMGYQIRAARAERVGGYDKAESLYRLLLQAHPLSPDIRFNFGKLLFRQGALDQAAVHFERALAIDPDYAEAHNNLGTVFARQGNLEQAEAHFEAALRINPEHDDAEANLSRLRSNH